MKQVIKDFMGACGILPSNDLTREETLEYWKLFANLMLEEVLEFKESVEQGDFVNAVKELGDVDWYVKECIVVAEAANVDYTGALQAVGENNRLKYSPSREVMVKELEKWYHVDADYADSLYIDENHYDGETWFCLKNITTNKVKKHVSFPSVCLKEFIPRSLW